MKTVMQLWLVLLMCSVISAQRGMISPIPAWPPDGNLTDSLQNQYVFLGPRLGEVIVSYPASLDVPGQTGRKTFTFELRNQVNPTFAVQLMQDSTGLFSYDYTLRNGEARQPIEKWFLVTPMDDPGFRVSAAGWSAGKSSAASGRQIALPTILQIGATTVFYAAPIGELILPGSARSGFHVTSSYSPGFTTAYVAGATAVNSFNFSEGELPTVVADQVGILQQPQWDSKVVIILGPRFPPQWSQQAIAADFFNGLTRLVDMRTLQADSPFVKAALDTLKASMQSGGVPNVAEALKALPAPAAGLESDIAAAMRLNAGRQPL